MAAELPGVNGVPGAPIPPSAPLRPVDPTRALVPLRPVAPGGGNTSPGDPPLGRSGVSLMDLLATTDVLVARKDVAPVALDMGLETARGALLRQRPGEALEALDAIWSRASASEEGWYLRSGALTVLGLASEADRVAVDGLERAPGSLALRFVLALARGARGDLAGARAALAPALEAAPHEPVLLAQQATMLARQGRGAEGEVLLARVRAATPDHPAVRWAQDEIRRVIGDQLRERSTAVVEGGQTDDGVVPVEVDVWPAETTDPGEEAFAQLGVHLRVAGTREGTAAVRLLLRAFSSGGALASHCLPDQAHGARTLLASIVRALRNDGRATVPAALASLLAVVRGGRVAETERALARDLHALPYAQRRWVDALLREVRSATARAAVTPRSVAAASEWERSALTGDVFGDGRSVVRDRRDDSASVPVRLGLGLLGESAAVRPATPARGDVTAIDPQTGEWIVPIGDGRAAAALMAASFAPTPSRDALDVGGVLPPLLALAVAAAAGLNGATVVSALGLVAAGWLALRRRTVSIHPPARADEWAGRGID
jgi:hypothetical protein